jgi:hypothetical protein
LADLSNIISSLDPISLEEMDRVKLQNRTDTKYIFNKDSLPEIIDSIKDKYFILDIEGRRTNSYETLYFDTLQFSSYINHHNGKLNREKIRFRNYVESELTFLEIKFKNNKSRTIKSRKQVDKIETELTLESKAFVKNNSDYNPENIIPTLWNSFTRLTLVHKTMNERLTIDLNLSFKRFDNNLEESIPHLIIAEVKQEKASANSDFIQTIKKLHIRKSGMSKYCVGTAILNKNLKSNNFKNRILKIKKLENA